MSLLITLSKKADGSMKFTGISEKDNAITRNREQFLNKLSISPESLVSAGLIHGNNVEIINNLAIKQFNNFIPQTDVLITNQKNIFLSITVGDCLPIYLYDPSSSTVGIIHAGWRGLKKNIIHETISKARADLRLDPARTLVSVGPNIGVCHFEIQQDVADQFKSFHAALSGRDSKLYLDLKLVAKTQLLTTGIKEKNIEISPVCTYEDENYFSYRRDKPEIVEAMLAVIGLRSNQ